MIGEVTIWQIRVVLRERGGSRYIDSLRGQAGFSRGYTSKRGAYPDVSFRGLLIFAW